MDPGTLFLFFIAIVLFLSLLYDSDKTNNKLFILEHRSRNKLSINEYGTDNANIVGIFSSKEVAEQWMAKNASIYDYVNEYSWYWFAGYHEFINRPVTDFMGEKDEEETFDLFYYNNNGVLIDEQPISGYST